ncbi:MAG: GNAT family N-acetyltransferase [Cumulibacter sp.]
MSKRLPEELSVIPAARSDSGAVADVLADAFAADEHTTRLLPTDNRASRLRRLFNVVVADTFASGGHAWLAVDVSDRAALGAALWEAPGARVPSWRTIINAPQFLHIFGKRALDAHRTDRSCEAHRPGVPHWYLKDIGTVTAGRGRGVGTALLTDRLSVADEQGVGVYLESSSRANVGYYRRFGFVERSVIPAYGTIELTGMWRPPAAKAS